MVNLTPNNAFIPEKLYVNLPSGATTTIGKDMVIHIEEETQEVEIPLVQKDTTNLVAVWTKLQNVVGPPKSLFERILGKHLPNEQRYKLGRSSLNQQLAKISTRIKEDSLSIKKIKKDISKQDQGIQTLDKQIKKAEKTFAKSKRDLDRLYKIQEKRQILAGADKPPSKRLEKLFVKLSKKIDEDVGRNWSKLEKPETEEETPKPRTSHIPGANSDRKFIYDTRKKIEGIHKAHLDALKTQRQEIVKAKKNNIAQLIDFKKKLIVSIPRFNTLKMASYDTGIEGLRTIRSMDRTLATIDNDLRSLVKIKGWVGNDIRTMRKDLKAFASYIDLFGIEDIRDGYRNYLTKCRTELERILKLPETEIDSDTKHEASVLRTDVTVMLSKV